VVLLPIVVIGLTDHPLNVYPVLVGFNSVIGRLLTVNVAGLDPLFVPLFNVYVMVYVIIDHCANIV
jgi:hypothetical protein